MGRDKAWMDLSGKTMIERVIAALRPAVASVSIIANSDEYKKLGLPVFADTNIGVGPLEAIRTALANTQTKRAVVVGCDLPFVTPELFSFLLAVEGDYQAIVPVGPGDRLQPMCAVYSIEALPIVTSLIESGARKVRLLFEQAPTRLVAFDEFHHLCGAEVFFQNVNTPEQYRLAKEIINRQ
jgi:molybdopterin-guanine dinucleotide biosynthesis protein A